MNIRLKEFVGNSQQGLLGAALNIGGISLLGSILPSSLVEGLNSVKQTVAKGRELYQTGISF